MAEKEFKQDAFLETNEKGELTKKIKDRLFAVALIEKYHFKAIRDTGEILYYKDGYYQQNGESIIRELTENTFRDLSSNHLKREVIGHVRDSTYIERDEVNTKEYLLNLNNIILDVKTDRFIEHTPKLIITSRLPVDYDPDAECPNINEFLRDIVSEENVKLLEEIAGYCLYRSYFIKKAIMLVAGGDNGKSIYLDLVRGLLGKENYAGMDLQRICNDRFSTAFLFGKLANIHGDLSSKALSNTGIFKMLTGGDAIPAEIKGGAIFHFDNFAKLIFSANKVPITYDSSTAFFSRWIIINFPFKFVNEPDTDNGEKKKIDEEKLKKKLMTKDEMSGFLNLALSGLQRLLENRDFSYYKTPDEIEAEYLRLSNMIYGFIEDKCELDVEAQTPKSELYNGYVDYCKEMKQSSMTINMFGRELQRTISVTVSHPKIEGRQVEAWRGVRMSDSYYL